MSATIVTSLKDKKDLLELFERLMLMKEAAPRSLTFTVAVTFNRDVTYKESNGTVSNKPFVDPLWSDFDV